jgi:hypothetical protein
VTSGPAGDCVVREYLMLALRLGRLGAGLVDAGSVDPALRVSVAAEAPPVPARLVRQAGMLARDLPAAGLAPERERFLAGQLRAVECTARRLTGQGVPFVREIEECFDVTARMGDEDGYRGAHRHLDALLPGPGPLAERLAAHRAGVGVPRDRIGAAVAELSAVLRDRTLAVAPLPAGESVSYEIVDDAPWSALHRYVGRYRSVVTVNAGARPRRAQLALLVAHEAYPGHHTERCRKEAGVAVSGWAELGVQVASSPQSLVAEGTAELGAAAVLGPDWGPVLADALAGLGLGFDGELAQRLDVATSALARVRQDAALLLHDRHAPPDDVLAHLRRWMLVDDRRARQVLRFLQHQQWRAYTTTYVEGPPLLRRWWELAPGPERFRRLLDEPLTPGSLRADLAA